MPTNRRPAPLSFARLSQRGEPNLPAPASVGKVYQLMSQSPKGNRAIPRGYSLRGLCSMLWIILLGTFWGLFPAQGEAQNGKDTVPVSRDSVVKSQEVAPIYILADKFAREDRPSRPGEWEHYRGDE